MKATRVKNEMPSLGANDDRQHAYRQFLQRNRGRQAYWRRWKAGYGVIS